MIIGKASYRICPHCWSLNSYFKGPFFLHLYGLTVWSDGEAFCAVPNTEINKLQKCDSCNKFYWFEHTLGQLSFEDYLKALEYFQNKYAKKNLFNQIFNVRNNERIYYIRLNILKRYNDSIR